MPIENMPVRMNFLDVGIWRPYRTGRGNTTVVISIRRLKTPRNSSRDL